MPAPTNDARELARERHRAAQARYQGTEAGRAQHRERMRRYRERQREAVEIDEVTT